MEQSVQLEPRHLALVASACVRHYLTRMTTIISSKGQIVIPADLRHQDGIEAGQEFEIQRIDRGEYVLKRKTRTRNEGLVDLLLACPVKGGVKPVRRDETTDDVHEPTLG